MTRLPQFMLAWGRKNELLAAMESGGDWCVAAADEHGVNPGMTWGTLPEADWPRWKKKGCDRLVQKARESSSSSSTEGGGGGGGGGPSMDVRFTAGPAAAAAPVSSSAMPSWLVAPPPPPPPPPPMGGMGSAVALSGGGGGSGATLRPYLARGGGARPKVTVVVWNKIRGFLDWLRADFLSDARNKCSTEVMIEVATAGTVMGVTGCEREGGPGGHRTGGPGHLNQSCHAMSHHEGACKRGA